MRYSDADAGGRLGLSALLDYLQQTAGDQTETLGFGYRDQLAQNVFWVLSRLSVQIERWPVWPGAVHVDTWARNVKGLLAFRDFRVSDAQVCARASSAWVVLKNQRPQRPEPWTKIYDLVSPEPPLSENPVILEWPEVNTEDKAQNLCQQSLPIESSWDDIDMNGHVNNRRAVLWCLAAHGSDFLQAHEPFTLDVNFLSQMFADQEYRLCWVAPSPSSGEVWDYGIFGTDSDKPCLKLRITWRACRS